MSPMLLPLLLCLLLPLASATPARPTLHPRQDELETRTLSPFTSSIELQPGGPAETASATTTYRLETATPPLQLPDTVGLIMPNPWSHLYVGESTFGQHITYTGLDLMANPHV